MVIAVTKFDACLLTDPFKEHNMMSVPEAQEIVCKQLAGVIGGAFDAKNIIVPVCSEWALLARMLRKYPTEDLYKKRSIAILNQCPDVHCGADGGLANEDPMSLATRLEDESRIGKLEERLACTL